MRTRIASAWAWSAALTLVAGVSTADEAGSSRATFAKDVLPILQKNCQVCHRPAGANLSGMVAPMAFMSYEEVRPWAKSIARAVQTRQMPPWHAAPEFHGVFANERTLSDRDIATIVNWVGAGAPRGDAAEAPPALKFPQTGGWSFEPDLVVAFSEPFLVRDEVQDLYQNIAVEIPEDKLPEDRYIQALEFKPGSEVVHHIIASAIPPGGRSQFGGMMIGGMAPGTDPHTYREGYGMLLRKGSRVVFQMHYHKERGPGTARPDVSAVAFKFHDGPVTHPVRIDAIGNGGFEIPPFHPRWEVGGARTFPRETILLSLMPHMHLRGKAARFVAFYPDGRAETLLEVPEYDFNWQTVYEFKEPRRLPAGTRLEVTLVYENTAERGERAGIDPSRPVRFGGPTTDEMDLGFIFFADAEPAASSAGSGSEAGGL